jgi:hypothetical protein
MDITQNYNDFTPRNFKTILVIPSAIRWIANSLTKYIEISSLNDYRNTSTKVWDLGNTEIANTVDFNFWAKLLPQMFSSRPLKGFREPEI